MSPETSKNVFLYYVWSFVSYFVLLTAVLVPFFSRVGLSQTEIQSLQAIFQVMVFAMEVPTGVVGDWLGRKWSLVLYGLLSGVGFLFYSVADSFVEFAFIEIVLATGIAFRSGSDQALIYDSLKRDGIEDVFGSVVSKARIFSLLSMSFASVVGSWSLKFLDMSMLVRMTGVALLCSMVVSLFFYEPDNGNSGGEDSSEDGSEVKRWHEILVLGWKFVLGSKVLLWLMVEASLLRVLGYFVVWLYQVRLVDLGVNLRYFGFFSAFFTMAQVVWMYSWKKFVDRFGWSWLLIWSPVIAGVGYFVVLSLRSWVGVVLWFLSSGVFGLTSREVLSVVIQKQVSSKVRATVVSFVGMVRSLSVALVNPVVGYVVDIDLRYAFVLLGVIGLLGYFVGVRTSRAVGE